MRFGVAVKEKIARVISEYFTTDKIVNVFADANIPTDKTLYAKWRITLDAFGKMSEPEEGIPHILEIFCHPLHFDHLDDPEKERKSFIKKLNAILTYANFEIKATDRGVRILDDGFPTGFSTEQNDQNAQKTSTDYVMEAIKFFKNEYNKVRISGLKYEYWIGEIYGAGNTVEYSSEYTHRLKAIKRLTEAGFVTEYTIGGLSDDSGNWEFAICKIDESKIMQKEAPRATDAGVHELAQKVIHEHTHRFENGKDELSLKMAITEMPELQVRNVEDVSIVKGKKRLHLPKFNPTDWANITLHFIDEQNVLITAYKKQVSSDYEALGFADDKRGKPNSAWVFLLGLARNNGETKPLPPPIPANIRQQKKQLSDRLKTIFKNDTPPFHDPTETHVYKIKITLIPPHADDTKADEFGVQEYLKDTMVETYDQ